jgi:RimJ/RimL family protein N-acetyltransferase
MAEMPAELVSERLVLRPLSREDAVRWWDDGCPAYLPRVADYPVFRTGMAVARVVRNMGRAGEPGWGLFLILRREDSAVVGDISLHRDGDTPVTVWISYEVAASVQGHGIASEAVRCLVDWVLTRPEVGAVRAEILEGNTRSEGVARAAGLTRTDEKRGQIWECRR